jgi:hypothetical protein
MTIQASISQTEAAGANEPSRAPGLAALGRLITGWFETAADYCAAAALYESLAALSDAELSRRGLCRADLARSVCEACDRQP